MKKIILLAVALILALGLLAGCSEEIIEPNQEEIAKLTQYESPAGVKVKMAEGFAATELEGVDCAWLKEGVALSCNIETFETLEQEGFSVEDEKEYARLSVKQYGHNVKPMTSKYGLTFMTYNRAIQNTSYSYAAFYFKGESSYLCATFTFPTEEFEAYKEDVHLWATTIEFEG